MSSQAVSRQAGAPLEVLHDRVPGRLRLRLARVKHAEGAARGVEAALLRRPGVNRVQANTLTGSVLILFETGLAPETVRRWAADAAAGDEDRRHRTASADWHVRTTTELLKTFDSRPSGLTVREARRRLAEQGPNTLAEPVGRSRLSILLDQFRNLPTGLLIGSAAVSLFTGGLVDAAVITAVVVGNALIGYRTESHAEAVIASLSRDERHSALVRRGGRPRRIPAADVVPGDILVLGAGEVIAADARVLEARNLAIDESVLTGEAMPAPKGPEPLLRRETPLAERFNMVYRGTMVESGGGLAVVVATGDATELGVVQALVGQTAHPPTPMQRQLETLGRQIAAFSAAVCVAVLAIGLLRGYGLAQMLRMTIALGVAAVPEGLPTVATTSLAFGLRDMRRRKLLVRRLGAVEALGTVQVVCFDKTGTLTRNMMTVSRIRCGGTEYAFDGDNVPRRLSEPAGGAPPPELTRLLEVGVLCSDARVRGESDSGWTVEGSATEAALVRAALMAGIDVGDVRRRHPRQGESYREGQRQSMTTLHAVDGGRRLAAVKGNPQEVLSMCRNHMRDGRVWPLDDRTRAALHAENEALAGAGLRVLGFAFAEAPEDRLVWLGLVGMVDPVRQGMDRLVRRLHEAGIETAMVTGDQVATAAAIGRELDLGHGREPKVMDARMLDALPAHRLADEVSDVRVFARISPAHKLRIVQAYQRGGLVVAMTGDGINDGPALKAADIGVAMAGRGTDVARDLADVVVEDDELGTLVVGIARGRTIYTNIRKSMNFLVATNMSEIVLTFGATAAGLGQPLNPLQLLWINTASDVLPGLALSVEPEEPDVMRQPPRDPDAPILGPDTMRRLGAEAGVMSAGAFAAYLLGTWRHGAGARASSMATVTLVTAQLLHAQTCRSDSCSIFDKQTLAPNRALATALHGTFAAQGLAAMIPPVRRMLGLVPLGPADLLTCTLAGTLPFLINEGQKFRRARRRPIKPPSSPGDLGPVRRARR